MKSWGKGKVKRLIGAGAGLIFKGSGFYITDYRSEGYKNAAESASKSESPAAKPAAADHSPSTSKESKDSKGDAKKSPAPESNKIKKFPPKKS